MIAHKWKLRLCALIYGYLVWRGVASNPVKSVRAQSRLSLRRPSSSPSRFHFQLRRRSSSSSILSSSSLSLVVFVPSFLTKTLSPPLESLSHSLYLYFYLCVSHPTIIFSPAVSIVRTSRRLATVLPMNSAPSRQGQSSL